jgi:glycine/D-amino acid oxidase-like deaminating enzyme
MMLPPAPAGTCPFTADARGRVHVVGAGVAGLAAALALADRGAPVCLYEAAPLPGGRARALPDGSDNGTHALLAGNRAALAFLGRIGAREGWLEPEPEGLPLLDLASGAARRVALSAAGWLRGGAPVGLTPGGVLALCRLLLPWGDGPLAARFAAYPGLVRGFVEPLAVAALNTPLSEASSALFAAVLRRVLLPGAGRVLVARRGLGPDLVAPALAALAARGVRVLCRVRLKAIEVQGGRAAVLRFAGAEEVRLGRGERVLLALPPWEAARLLPGTPAPAEFSPILNLHFARPAETPLRFLGLMGGLGQWVLLRPAGIAVTISAADAALALPTDTLARRVWAEVRRLATAFALPGPWPDIPPPWRVVAERRATPRHRPGARRLPPRLPLPNLAFAGDWTDPVLPATLEAAVRSGEDAAMALLRSVP